MVVQVSEVSLALRQENHVQNFGALNIIIIFISPIMVHLCSGLDWLLPRLSRQPSWPPSTAAITSARAAPDTWDNNVNNNNNNDNDNNNNIKLIY